MENMEDLNHEVKGLRELQNYYNYRFNRVSRLDKIAVTYLILKDGANRLSRWSIFPEAINQPSAMVLELHFGQAPIIQLFPQKWIANKIEKEMF